MYVVPIAGRVRPRRRRRQPIRSGSGRRHKRQRRARPLRFARARMPRPGRRGWLWLPQSGRGGATRPSPRPRFIPQRRKHKRRLIWEGGRSIAAWADVTPTEPCASVETARGNQSGIKQRPRDCRFQAKTTWSIIENRMLSGGLNKCGDSIPFLGRRAELLPGSPCPTEQQTLKPE